MEFDKCYVFEPDQTRPVKRRRVEPEGLQASWRLRREAYQQAWQKQQWSIDDKLNALNEKTVIELSVFLNEHISVAATGAIPTGIISIGPDTASQASITEKLSRAVSSGGRRIVVPIAANEATNLKALLKTIIQKATTLSEAIEDNEDDDVVTRKGSKLLNYDLQILSDYVQDRDVKQVVLAVQDTEAFDSHLLSEFIELLGYWLDRVPFVLLLSTATSLDFLQGRLSREAVKCINGREFDVAPSAEAIDKVFEEVTHSESALWIGPNLMRFVLERQSDYIQSVDSFVDAIRYTYMSCYYANALSIFLDPLVKYKDVPADHFEASRNLPSFRKFCQELVESDQPNRLQDLLENDEILFGFIRQQVHQGRDEIAKMTAAVDVVQELQLVLPNQQHGPKSALYIQAMSNKLKDSSMLRSLLLSIRKAPSDVVSRVFDVVMALELSGEAHYQCEKIQNELLELVSNQNDAGQPLRSEDDLKNSTLRTTVVAQKVELSKQKSSLSKQDAAYTKILRCFTDLLEGFVNERLVDPNSLLFHEIFVYDLKSPHREVFTPRPRHAIERALSSPHDYLACDCCAPREGEGEEATLAACQPATVVVYQLYLESGSLINASDLWQAFQAVMGDEQPEEQNTALFQRALAELRYLGLVKGTRKRVDHVGKVAWRGL